ncbi:hypothetical protein PMIT1303_00708 [Prochlorococcus sp. MIT 1303]|nr:hypothetical protein PMIT1303_00708 [Prochlorococcus sp. MIT 1303]
MPCAIWVNKSQPFDAPNLPISIYDLKVISLKMSNNTIAIPGSLIHRLAYFEPIHLGVVLSGMFAAQD